MPITPYLRGEAFDPETLKAMGDAFGQACGALGLKDRSDKLTEMVARHIVEAARHGVRTKTALYRSAMNEFKANSH
jgi:hypothetical protein